MPPPQQSAPVHLRAWRFALAVATGQHALSQLVPPALWLLDAILCVLVLWKVPCTWSTLPPPWPDSLAFLSCGLALPSGSLARAGIVMAALSC